MSGAAGGDWSDRRAEAIGEHEARLARRRAAEQEKARGLVADFVREAQARGLPVVPLRARAHNGRATYRTGRTGWYVRRNRSLAVGEDGAFYVLSTPTSVRALFAGVTLEPSEPPLAVGVGARDGESMSLEEMLRLRLEAGPGWPDAG